MEHVATDPSEIKIPSETTPDPKRDHTRATLRMWAEAERMSAHGRDKPFAPEWWGAGPALLTRIGQLGGNNSGEIDAVQLTLRGADVECVAMLDHLESIAPEAMVRALFLCGFVVAIHEREHLKCEETIEVLLDILAAYNDWTEDTPEHAFDGPSMLTAGHRRWSYALAQDIGCTARLERRGEERDELTGGPWVAWYAGLVGTTPSEQRWIVTAVYEALTSCADAMDPDRADDEWLDVLGRFLMTGELPDGGAS